MSNINSVVISGNLVSDCERAKAGETPLITFTIASNEFRRNNQTGESDSYANFIECTMFGKRVTSLAKYMVKGTKLMVLGHLRQQRWEKDGEKRSKLGVIVEEIEIFLPKKESDDLKHAQEEIPW